MSPVCSGNDAPIFRLVHFPYDARAGARTFRCFNGHLDAESAWGMQKA